MKGDFTRNTFDPRRRFSGVLMQQGRAQLDADANEQVAIFWHYLRTLATDLMGPHAGPADHFVIEVKGDELGIGPGRYYVEGVLCENNGRYDENGNPLPLPYDDQPGFPFPDSLEDLSDDLNYLVYIDVWERLITAVEDDSLREVALGGPDTAVRAQIVWQVKTQEVDANTDCADIAGQWDTLVSGWQPLNRGQLRARARVTEETTDPCLTSPDARYRGVENQLYRVEIHRGGLAWGGENYDGQRSTAATFKWSRDNGSVVFPIVTLKSRSARVTDLGRDDSQTLNVGDWVEVVDDNLVLRGTPGPLLMVDAVNPVDMTVTLVVPEGMDMSDCDYDEDSPLHPLLRRWDQTAVTNSDLEEGAMLLQEGQWLDLEDGVQLYFVEDGTYRSGDYWLIPARTATGDVEWPGLTDEPEAVAPHGIRHYYAPLAVKRVGEAVEECRREIPDILWNSPQQ